jgi:hypothetical protein
VYYSSSGNQTANSKINGLYLTYSAYASSTQGSIVWNCKSSSAATKHTTVADKWLPQVCRS